MTQQHKNILLSMVQSAILEEFDPIRILNKKLLLETIPKLKEEKASFVTLYLNGELRGCIGTLKAYQSLFDDLVFNAKSAAFNDTRFKPLTFEEYQNLTFEISILETPQEIEYRNTEDLRQKIRPKVDGVILELNGKQATFLPQVWEELPYFDDFFAQLGQKAGLGPHILDKNPKISIYEVDKF